MIVYIAMLNNDHVYGVYTNKELAEKILKDDGYTGYIVERVLNDEW